MKALLRDAGLRVLRANSIRRAALAGAALRRRVLILVYHRVTPHSAPIPAFNEAIVSTVPSSLLRKQLEALATIGDFVPLMDLVSPTRDSFARAGRPRFCLTFDDDEPAHTHHVLPVLRALHLPATFFLSGRSLHGLGPPWWILLEAQIARAGLRATAASLGVLAGTAAELALACEGSPRVQVIERTFAPAEMASISREEIATLAAAPGVTIGFHTLEHPTMTGLDDAAIGRALRTGRPELAKAAGGPVDLFAYPHGRADSRVARHVANAGFSAAVRSGNRPVGTRSDPFLLGRWEPGPMPVDDLVAEAALRFNLSIRP